MQLCGEHERRNDGKGEGTDSKEGPRVVEKEKVKKERGEMRRTKERKKMQGGGGRGGGNGGSGEEKGE